MSIRVLCQDDLVTFKSSCWFSLAIADRSWLLSVLVGSCQHLYLSWFLAKSCKPSDPQEPEALINNVKELLALQVDHQGRNYQPDESLNQKSANEQLESKKAFETDCNTLNMEDEDYDHLNYTRTVNELSPNYIKLNNEK